MNIHIVMPFYRNENKELYKDFLVHHGFIWHPISCVSEPFNEKATDNIKPCWILPPGYLANKACVGYYKLNQFIKNEIIVDDDYYWIICDDDWFDDSFIKDIKNCTEDVIFVSMHRGYNIPEDIDDPIRRHPVHTLLATPENIHLCSVGIEQYIVKGRVFKTLQFRTDTALADGYIGEHLKNTQTNVVYKPDWFVWFNFLEPGRWIEKT